ncbi:MAG: response regulator [Blastocatellia bacterium]
MSKTKVLLADDHTIVAEGLRSLLEDDFDLVGTVNDGRALLKAAHELRPDVIVVDISMPLLNGLDAVRQLKRDGVPAKIVFLTMHAEAQMATEAFRAGASGYLLKQSAGEELITAIHEVVKGRSYVTPLITKDVLSFLMDVARNADRPSVRLTPRQREVLQLIAEGRAMKEIASILNISARTVESHKYEMMETLGVESTPELVQYAIKIGLVSVSPAPQAPSQ